MNLIKKYFLAATTLFFLSGVTFAQSLEQKVSEYISPFVKNGDFSGTVLIAKDDRIVFNRAFGIANREWNVPHNTKSKFLIGSISKPITALAVLKLVQDKKLSLDTPISQFVDEFPQGDKITVGRLLSHTAGLRSGRPDASTERRLNLTTEQMVSRIKDIELRYGVGERFYYSNNGYIFLAYIIERISNTTYDNYLRENIFEPLEMNDSFEFNENRVIRNLAEGYRYEDWGGIKNSEYQNFTYLRGAGSIISTSEDLFKLARAIPENKILKREMTAKMLTPQSKDYGFGWYIRKSLGTDIVEHNGYLGGYRSYLTVYPKEDYTVIILSNIGANNAVDVMKTGLGAIMLGKDYKIPAARVFIKLNKRQRKSVAGRYKFDFSPQFRLIVRDNPSGFLDISVGGPFSVLFPESELKFFHRNSQSEYIFYRNEQGKIDQVDMTFFGRKYLGKRVDN